MPILGTQFEVENAGFRNSGRWRNLRYRLQICRRSIAWYVGRSGLKGLARDANPAVWIPHQSYSLIVPAVRSPGFPLFSGEHIFGSMNSLAGYFTLGRRLAPRPLGSPRLGFIPGVTRSAQVSVLGGGVPRTEGLD